MKKKLSQKSLEDPKEIISEDPELIEKIEEICKDKKPFKHIEAMDYPRMAGTDGEKSSAKYIETKFHEYGLEPKIGEFYIPESSKASKVLIPIFLIIWGVFSFINVLYISGIFGYIFTILVLLVPVIVFLVILKLEIVFKKMLARNYKKIQDLTKRIEEGNYEKPVKRGRNIYVEYIPKEYDEHLYLTAHHDSTTLKFNIKYIKIFMIFGVLGGIIYILSYLLNYLLLISSGFDLFGAYPLVFLIILIIFLVSMSIVLFGRVFRTNESHGAIDNLTGTSIILELTRIAQIIKPKLKITFIVFSAEEVGLYGSAYHYNTYKEYFQTNNVHVVSIDMIGEIPPLILINRIKPAFSIPTDPGFNKQMVQLAQKLGIEIKLGKFIYPGSDFANWFLNSHRANWVMAPSKYHHSAKDLPQNVNQGLLNDCLKLFTAYLLENSK